MKKEGEQKKCQGQNEGGTTGKAAASKTKGHISARERPVLERPFF